MVKNIVEWKKTKNKSVNKSFLFGSWDGDWG